MEEDEAVPDRRGLDRRVETLERRLGELDKAAAVMQATLNGLILTMNSRYDALEHGQALILKSIDGLEKMQVKIESDMKLPQDMSKIVFSPGVVVAIVMTIISIVAGQQASTWGIRSDQQLQSERMASLKTAVESIVRKQELGQIQQQELREAILGQQRKTR